MISPSRRADEPANEVARAAQQLAAGSRSRSDADASARSRRDREAQALIESPRTFWAGLSGQTTRTVHAMEIAPMAIVENVGRQEARVDAPNTLGNACWRAMDSVVRAVADRRLRRRRPTR